MWTRVYVCESGFVYRLVVHIIIYAIEIALCLYILFLLKIFLRCGSISSFCYPFIIFLNLY